MVQKHFYNIPNLRTLTAPSFKIVEKPVTSETTVQSQPCRNEKKKRDTIPRKEMTKIEICCWTEESLENKQESPAIHLNQNKKWHNNLCMAHTATRNGHRPWTTETLGAELVTPAAQKSPWCKWSTLAWRHARGRGSYPRGDELAKFRWGKQNAAHNKKSQTGNNATSNDKKCLQNRMGHDNRIWRK